MKHVRKYKVGEKIRFASPSQLLPVFQGEQGEIIMVQGPPEHRQTIYMVKVLTGKAAGDILPTVYGKMIEPLVEVPPDVEKTLGRLLDL